MAGVGPRAEPNRTFGIINSTRRISGQVPGQHIGGQLRLLGYDLVGTMAVGHGFDDSGDRDPGALDARTSAHDRICFEASDRPVAASRCGALTCKHADLVRGAQHFFVRNAWAVPGSVRGRSAFSALVLATVGWRVGAVA